MPADQPLWLKVVLRLERAIGEPVESAVRSETYFDVISTANRVRHRAIGAVEGVSRRALHVLNLPTASDVRRMRQQLARMERRLNQLSEEVGDMDDREPRSGAR
jgi:hypothetical protein